MARNEKQPTRSDKKQVSNVIAVASIIGMVICFVAAITEGKEIPLNLYAIFGGGILGTDSVLAFLKAIFRINDNE